MDLVRNLSMLTRRRFLTVSSLAMTSELATPSLRKLWAARAPGTRVVAVPARSSAPVAYFLEPVADAATLRALAATALDAARQAGADWADIRLGAGRAYEWREDAVLTYNFGVRVRVDGVEAFVGGGDPTPDRLAHAARSAVATARGLASGGTRPPTIASAGLTPVPVVTGEWAAPFEIDPFAVTIDQHAHVQDSLNGLDDVRLAHAGVRREWDVVFRAETRVTASSEGTLVTQELRDVAVLLNLLRKGVWRFRGSGERLELPFWGYGSCTGGFEVVARLNRFAHLEQASQELLAYETLPGGIVEVGRYPVVLDGVAHASVLQRALVPALSLRRALWYDTDVGGTSPLRPVTDVLGHQRFSPLLSLQVDHGPPAFGACRWDAEGVPAIGGPLVTNGTVVNYITTRATHAVLTAMLSTAPSHETVPPLLGSTTATQASDQPTELPASVSMPAAPNGGTLAELAKQVGTGLVARGGDAFVNPDGTGGMLDPLMMFEVKGGQLVRRVYGASLQFSTKKLFTALKAVGNASTMGETTHERSVGFPATRILTSLMAPAALYGGMDVVTHG